MKINYTDNIVIFQSLRSQTVLISQTATNAGIPWNIIKICQVPSLDTHKWWILIWAH